MTTATVPHSQARSHHPHSIDPVFADYLPFPNEDGRNWRQQRLEIPVMIWALDLAVGVRVLEVGCGRGIALPVLRERLQPTRLVGLDIDPSLLAIAAASADPDTELVEGDLRNLPFEDGAFDLVIDFGTTFHLDRPGRALREVARVLAPNGLFAVETKVSQWLSHPIRTQHRFLPWSAAPELQPERHAVLWQSRRRRNRP